MDFLVIIILVLKIRNRIFLRRKYWLPVPGTDAFLAELGEGSEAYDSTFPGMRRQGYLTCKFSTLMITL